MMKNKLLTLLLAALLCAACTACAVWSVQPTNKLPDKPENSTNADEKVENSGSQEEQTAEKQPTTQTEPDTFPQTDSKTVTIDTLLAQMTLEEKVGQMFFVRCPAENQVALIEQYHLGGYLLFGRDFKDSGDNWLTAEQVANTIASYQAASQIPMLIGVDEEGGTVTRVSRNPNLAASKRQSPQQVFASGGLEGIYQDALDSSALLLGLGINVNFAPVADVSTDPSDFIYDRAFGQDAEATADYVRTAVTAMGEAGIGSVLKHFPGYGSNVDTHTGIANDDRPYEDFVWYDFLPFQSGIEAGAGAVLVCHNIVECMDSDLPASLSPEVHRILREELGFTGVALTDDLAMDAVEAYAEDGSVAVLAVLAGNDMIVTTDFETQIPLVIAAVQDGTISEDTINTAVARVLAWKYDLGLLGGEE